MTIQIHLIERLDPELFQSQMYPDLLYYLAIDLESGAFLFVYKYNVWNVNYYHLSTQSPLEDESKDIGVNSKLYAYQI